MTTCYICENKISDINRSWEHILINACGGRLKSDKLLCKDCNSKTGSKNDSELANQLNTLANLLNIERERGEPQVVYATLPSTGEKYCLHADGSHEMVRPIIEKIPVYDGLKIHITTSTKSKLIEILNGLKRNNKNIDIDECLKHAISKSVYHDEPYNIKIDFGGNRALKSVCKSAINYYIFRGGNRKYIEHYISPLKNDADKIEDVQPYFDEKTSRSLGDNEVSHCIYIEGNPAHKTMFAYIEYFNSITFLVVLNRNYDGPEFKEQYCYDVLLKKEIDAHILPMPSIAEIVNYKYQKGSINFKIIESRIGRILGIAQKRKREQWIKQLIQESIDYSLKKYPEGCIITPEMRNELSKELMKRLKLIIERLSGAQLDKVPDDR